MNKIFLVGRVGNDPEVRHLDSGSVVAKISLATNKSWKGKDGQKQTETQWHNLELWEGIAKVAEQYVEKGMRLAISGEIKYDKWEDEQGNKRTTTKIRVQDMTMLDHGNSDSQGAESKPAESKPAESKPANNPFVTKMDKIEASGDEDDLPF